MFGFLVQLNLQTGYKHNDNLSLSQVSTNKTRHGHAATERDTEHKQYALVHTTKFEGWLAAAPEGRAVCR